MPEAVGSVVVVAQPVLVHKTDTHIIAELPIQ